MVDDESSDGTAALARDLGATVITGAPLPPGWVGKPWALDQGLRAASGDWVVSFDADVEPAPGLARALVGRGCRTDGLDMVSVAGRFVCPTAPLRVLHPAFLTTLVYRFGPPGSSTRRGPARVLANGQCTAARRADLLGVGGYDGRRRPPHRRRRAGPRASPPEDGGRACSTAPRRCAVRMHTSAGDAWRALGAIAPHARRDHASSRSSPTG